MSWITLDQAKERLGIPCTDPSRDAQVQSAIDYSIALVETYCRRQFEQLLYTQEFFPAGLVVYLRNWPLVSIDNIYLDDEEQLDVEYTIDPIRGVVYFKTGFVTASNPELLRLVYTAGYNPIPENLLNATLDVVMARYNTSDDDPSRGPIKMERMEGSVSVSYGTPGGANPETGALNPHLMVLNTYRSEATQGAW